MRIERDVPLAPLTTLGLGGPARRLARVRNVGELRQVLDEAKAAAEPVLVLGGGSNLVVRDGGFAGTVVVLDMPEVRIRPGGDAALVSAFAGAPWDDFVARMVDEGLAGVECLSGIPGRAGATPIQNVGAYGQAVADTIVLVRAYDRQTGQVETLDPAACRFGYRSSAFRGGDRWIVLEVRFRLRRSGESAPLAYLELARALGVAPGSRAPIAEVRRAVLELRRSKGMVCDPADPESRSAGSFFTNPTLDATQLAALAERLPGVVIPGFPGEGGATRIPAAWLIERAGFAKGHTRGGVGISRKHALALVNRGGTASELLALARAIQDRVAEALGIALALEPVVVGSDAGGGPT